MSNIVPFPKDECRPIEPKPWVGTVGAGEIVIFPGVRYEYQAQDAVKLGNKR